MVPSGLFSAVFEAGDRLCLCEEIEGGVLDDGHVGGAMSGSQACQIIAEDDIKYPVQAVLDPPMPPHDTCEGLDVKLG